MKSKKKAPKYEEELAKQYLHSIGFVDTDIVYEPDGRDTTPDFVIDRRIAVEVRRLNQQEITASGKLRGLEDLQFALTPEVEEVLHSFGPPKLGKSWSVRYTFGRPYLDQRPNEKPDLRHLKAEIKKNLTAFLNDPTENELFINDRFTMELNPWNSPAQHCFHLRGYYDQDTIGFTVTLLQKNIQLCIDEKTAKIAKVREKYPEWWLVLIDQIGYGKRESIKAKHDWDKVVLLNPLNPTNGYEI